jgi:hypothetical protein
MSWQRIAIAVTGIALASASVWACGSDDPAPPPADPTSRENASAIKGGEAVKKRKCVECHTDSMAGAVKAIVPAGTVADPRVELYPPNLTPDPETGIGPAVTTTEPGQKGYTDELLARAIRNGLDRDDLELCPQMKHFADMTDFEVYSIVKYLRGLPPVNQKILRSVCPPLKTKEEQTAASK